MLITSALDPRAVKREADFVTIVSRYTKLRRAGRQFVGLCPFHSERTPSFYVHPQLKVWKCFGCGRGGDVFDFVMLAENCDFSAALRVVSGVAEASAPLGARFGRGEGAQPLARGAGVQHSQNPRAAILARLAETARRNAAIRRANSESSAEFVTLCEPERGGVLLVKAAV